MEGFDQWLGDVDRVFRSALSPDQRMLLLQCLVDGCSGELLHRLSLHLDSVIKRDFVRLLPDCAQLTLLSYLDVKTLLTACQVCQAWNCIISENQLLWKRRCQKNGFSIPKELFHTQLTDSYFLKRLFLENSALVNELVKGFSYDNVKLLSGAKEPSAIFYYNGRIALGSSDRIVRIWCCASRAQIATYETHSVADLKFDDHFLVTASFDRTAACWNVSTGTQLCTYVGHVGAVLCVDYNTSLNVLVTGSIDLTVKIWSFSNGCLLRTLDMNFTLLGETFVPNVGDVKILSVTDSVEFYHILISNGREVIDYEIERSVASLRRREVLFAPDEKSVRVSYHINNSSLKILSWKSNCTRTVKVVAEMNIKNSVSLGKSLSSQVSNCSIAFNLPLNLESVSYLGHGACFGAFSGFRIVDQRWFLCVSRCNSESGGFVIGLPFPISVLFNGNAMRLCDQRWLDGISRDVLCGKPLAAVNLFNGVQLLTLDSS